MADQIRNSDSFLNWIEMKPLEWGRLLALRSALRVLPMIAFAIDGDRLRLSVFRAMTIAWAAHKFPNHDIARAASAAASRAAHIAVTAKAEAADASASADAGDPAGDAAMVAAAYAAAGAAVSAAAAVRAQSAVVYSADSAAEAISVAAAASGADSAIWSEVERDIAVLEQQAGSIAGAVIARPLWDVTVPSALARAWLRLEDRMTRDPDAWVWRDWYNRRLVGTEYGFAPYPEDDEAITLRIVDKPDTFWSRDFAAVNADIAAWLKEARQIVDQSAESRPIDFFISYAAGDEPMAREMAAILDSAGYTSLAQFRDFAPGMNFVREMQRGLASSSRLIALLSPAYEASDHCQAEWAAAYADDPGARSGKIVPFKIAEVDLNELAKQIVYRSLIGLTASERRVAVLEAVGHWREARSKAAGIAVPHVVVEGERLTVKAGSAKGARALQDAPSSARRRLLQHAERIRDTYPKNLVRRPLHYIEDYARELREGGEPPDVEWLNDCEFPFRRAFEAGDRREWSDGLAEDVERFFARHQRFMRYFDVSNREQALGEVSADPVGATSEAIASPMRDVSDMISDVRQAGFTTPEFDAAISRQIELAEQFDDSQTDNPDAKVANDKIKGRFLLNQIGFYERVLIAIGATATIASAPSVAAAVPVIEHAIQRLLALLL